MLGDDDMALREWPTVALTALAREAGARIHRVHSVRPNLEAMRMVEAVAGAGLQSASRVERRRGRSFRG